MPDSSDNLFPSGDAAASDEVCARLRAALTARGVRATPLCRAVMGWLCQAPTEPSVAEARVGSDGRVWLRLSDEAYPEPVGTFLEFLEQVRVLCDALALTDAQTRRAVGLAQTRLFGPSSQASGVSA